MHRLALVLALVAAPSLAGAATIPTLPLSAPPVEANPTSNQIFDAMLAISRAAVSNPQAAQRASFQYQAAIQQYQSGDLDRARESAVSAIAAAGAPALPTNAAMAPATGPAMPPVPNDPEAEMESRLGLARHALTECGPTTSAPFTTERTVYDGAVRDLLAGRLDDLNRTVQGIIDACASVHAGQSGPSIPAGQ